MMRAVIWTAEAVEDRARAGNLHTPHGVVPTPAFMPVGTRGAGKTIDSRDLESVSTRMVLANTCHLMLRPGSYRVAGLGGLYGFMAWPGPILTDSGGYQVYSLGPRVDEDGVRFKSICDGSHLHLTPEKAVAVQEQLGAEIAMVLDVLIGLPAPREAIKGAMQRTLRWSDRGDRRENAFRPGPVRHRARRRRYILEGQIGFPDGHSCLRWVWNRGIGRRRDGAGESLGARCGDAGTTCGQGPIRHGVGGHQRLTRCDRARRRSLRFCAADASREARQGAPSRR